MPKTLELNYNRISDLSPLSELVNLNILKLVSNEISDMNDLTKLINLQWLDLRFNQISDISPFFVKNNEFIYYRMYIYDTFFKSLDLGNNKIPQSQIDVYKPALWDSFGNDYYRFGVQYPDKEKMGTITIHYKDIDTNQLISTEVYENVLGASTYNAKVIPGYILEKNHPRLTTLIIREDGQSLEYTFRYTKDIYYKDTIEFECVNLENLARLAVDKIEAEGKVLKQDVEKVTVLKWPKRPSHEKITSLKGIEHFLNLDFLDLYDHEISDIGPLEGLQKLKELNLGKNKITDISPLAGLKELMILNLSNNKIHDIRGISQLENLASINLRSNYISNIDSLVKRKYLFDLYLDDNQISDISVLKQFPTLKELSLSYNQISDISPLFDGNNRFIYYGMTNEGLELDNNRIPQSQINLYGPILNIRFNSIFDFGIQYPSLEETGWIEFKHQTNIPHDKVWTILFNSPIDFDTLLDPYSIYITSEDKNRVDIDTLLEDTMDKVQIKPNSNYESKKTYILWVENINSLDGEALQNKVKMYFTID